MVVVVDVVVIVIIVVVVVVGVIVVDSGNSSSSSSSVGGSIKQLVFQCLVYIAQAIGVLLFYLCQHLERGDYFRVWLLLVMGDQLDHHLIYTQVPYRTPTKGLPVTYESPEQ